MKTKKLLTLIAMASVILFSGCKKDKYKEIVSVCPIVSSTNPSNLSTGVPVGQVITVTFNEKMNPATITQQSFILKGTTQVLGTIAYDGTGTTMSFTPTTSLTPNTTYTGRVTTMAKDAMGNALQADYVWTFSTGTTVLPTVISTDPANNDTGVFLNKIVTATFSMPMNPTTINATTFLMKQGATIVAGTVTYNISTGYFTPSSSLMPNTVYNCTITTGAKNTSNTSIASDYIWSFTTGTVTAPKVISTDPISNASSVSLTKIVTATFDTPMNAGTINGTTFLLKEGTNAVAGTVTYAGSTASFTPTSNLLSGTVYTATITTGAMNPSGTPIANNYIWSFTTVPPLGAPSVDLQSVARFGIIAGVGVSNNAGFSIINNLDVGISPGVRSSITGFPPAVVNGGAIYASDDIAPPGVAAMLTQAKQDLTNAYLFAEGATAPAPATVSGDIGGTTLAPGIYKSTSTLLIQSGDLTLDGMGDANAVWIFQIASAFTTVGGAGGNIILTGGAQAKNVFWQTGSSATIGNFTSFQGTVLALTSITMGSNATAVGRMLARNGSVVLTSTNIINKP
ncbi:MAG TPA: Ig-like domain-containing protein [Bacteroidia bacterium]|nr:Ig-like domain-containing protein [Bacteroidia bacterium]